MGVISALLSNIPNQELHEGEGLDSVIFNAAGVIPNGIDRDYPEGFIVESTPGEFSAITIPQDGYYRLRTLVRWFNNTAAATVTIELRVNGTAVDSTTETWPAEGDPRVLMNPSWPEADFYNTGDIVSTYFHNDSQADGGYVDPGSSRSESFNFLAVEGFIDEGITEEELCDTIFSIEGINACAASGQRVVRLYTNDGTLVDTYKLKGAGLDLSPDSDQNLFVIQVDNATDAPPWSADTPYCLCNNQVRGDDKIFVVTAADGWNDTTQGRSGLSEPVWPGVGTVVDNDLTWSFVGPDDGLNDTWNDDFLYHVTDTVLGSDGNIYQVLSSTGVPHPDCGVSGSTEPIWPSSGSIVDNSVTWTFVTDNVTGDPRTFIEKFDSDGVSLGEFGPDHQSVLELSTADMAIVVGHDDTTWFLGWKDSPERLCLYHLDASGTLLNSWIDIDIGSVTLNTPFMDIGEDDKVYYTILGDNLIRAFDGAAGTQSDFTINIDDYFETINGEFGAIKLFVHTNGRGGIALTDTIDQLTFGFNTQLVEFDCAGLGVGRLPLINNAQPITLLCWADSTSKIWTHGDEPHTKLRRYDLNGTDAPISINLVSRSSRINSCTPRKGKGFVCEEGFFFPMVCLIGAS